MDIQYGRRGCIVTGHTGLFFICHLQRHLLPNSCNVLNILQTSSNFSSIIALGERHLYCFQDNGLMKYMIKFDFVPICFNAFLIGWYYGNDNELSLKIMFFLNWVL